MGSNPIFRSNPIRCQSLSGHICPTIYYVKGSEFIKRIEELGRKCGIVVRTDSKRGNGSHITLYYGNHKTIVKDRRKELGPGLLSKMIRALGLDRRDLL